MLPLTCTHLGTWSLTQTWALTSTQTCDLCWVVWCSFHWATPARANELISIRLVYKLKHHRDAKAMQFWKNGRLLPQGLSPVEYLKKNNPATFCQASPILGCTWSFLPSKIPSIGKHRQLQHNRQLSRHPPGRGPESQSLPSFYFKSSGS